MANNDSQENMRKMVQEYNNLQNASRNINHTLFSVIHSDFQKLDVLSVYLVTLQNTQTIGLAQPNFLENEDKINDFMGGVEQVVQDTWNDELYERWQGIHLMIQEQRNRFELGEGEAAGDVQGQPRPQTGRY